MMWKMLMQPSLRMKLKLMLVLVVTLSASWSFWTGLACPFRRRVTESTMHLYKKKKAIFMDKRNWVSGWYFLSCPTQGLSNCPFFSFPLYCAVHAKSSVLRPLYAWRILHPWWLMPQSPKMLVASTSQVKWKKRPANSHGEESVSESFTWVQYDEVTVYKLVKSDVCNIAKAWK